MSNAPDSYEGETGAVSNGTVLVGGSNHIYPGNCSTSAPTGTFGDCAPLAYVSVDGANWTHTALPRTWNGMTRVNVYAGPAGFYLVRGGADDLSSGLPGPAPALGDPAGMSYYEIPIVIQDRSFNGDGSLFYPDNRAFFEGLDPSKLKITENPELGATEIWELHNFTEDAHPIHVHMVMFEVVNRESLETGQVRGPEAWETGSKDTVVAYPDEITRVRATFDLAGRYVWHCHILEHEDNEMMRPYAVGPVQNPMT